MTKRLTYKQVKELEIFLDSLPKLNSGKQSKKNDKTKINRPDSSLHNEPKCGRVKMQ